MIAFYYFLFGRFFAAYNRRLYSFDRSEQQLTEAEKKNKAWKTATTATVTTGCSATFLLIIIVLLLI